MIKIKTTITNIQNWFSGAIERAFSDRKSTFKFIALFVFTILFVLEIAMILINNSFYNNASDDVLQYYTIMVDFVAGLKDGSVSWFNLNNYFGASFFSDVYYIPIDVFTGTTFLLSYLMPTELAYSITELIKIFAGVMLFAYYLSLKGMKNRTIFWMSMIYFIAGGSVSFMAFPVFLSLTAYMPLSLIVIHYFFHKKRWIVPLFAFASILYDFYLGYTLMAFISFAYIIEYIKEPGFKFFRFILDSIIFISLLLLGVLMAAAVAYPSIIYILEETYRNTGSFNSWDIEFAVFGKDIILKLFQPNIYIRLLSKMLIEQKPIGFYGFENSYATEHFSLYISLFGLVYMNYIFFMRDKISRIYKIAIIVGIFMMIIPLFSYVFSGTLDAPYTRWINMLPIFQIMILAYVFDRYGFEEVKMKYMTIIISILLLITGGLMYYYIYQLGLDDYLASRDVLTADTVLMGVAGLYLIILLVFGWLKKWTVVKTFFWIEFIVAIGYIYSGPLSITNKIDTFDNAHEIQEYLDSVIDDDTFYRVYVDINNLGVEDTNFNRMTGYATNTGIFHSWTDEETNDIGYLLFSSWEYQSKNKMNTFGYYLNHFLGYKYILTDADNDYAFDTQHFVIYAANENYRLYELVGFSSFQVYESYMTYDDFETYRRQNSDMATEKLLMMSAVIDAERYVTDELNLRYAQYTGDDSEEILLNYKTIYSYDLVTTAGLEDTTERGFYRYTNNSMDIQYLMGAIYLKSDDLDLLDYGEAFMEFADGTTKACWIQSGQAHQIKCEFFQTPVAFYLEKTDAMSTGPGLKIRQEAAIDAAAYLVYDLSSLDIESSSGIINFALSSTYSFGRTFVVDEYGVEHECLDGFYSFDSKPVKLYVFKTAKMYEATNIFALTIKASYEDLSDSSSILNETYTANKYLSIENGTINVEYDNLSGSTYDQLIVIPVAYSDDWIITSDIQYETISASGGFLGIIIPNGTTDIDITLTFVPKGLDIGGLASAAGILIYIGIFLPGWIKKRKNGVDTV